MADLAFGHRKVQGQPLDCCCRPRNCYGRGIDGVAPQNRLVPSAVKIYHLSINSLLVKNVHTDQCRTDYRLHVMDSLVHAESAEQRRVSVP